MNLENLQDWRMVPLRVAADTNVFHAASSALATAIVVVCLAWYCTVVLVCGIGYFQLWRHYSAVPRPAYWASEAAPHVTIIRPVRGLDPSLYECLASTFQQRYPKEKVSVRLCVSSRHDQALPVLERLIRDFPNFDAQILVEEEDVVLQDGHLGPNPKIRNMSRAYREAEGDIVWVIDCNVWVAKGVCGRMVARLEGGGAVGRKYKFVHQLPLVVDTIGTSVPQKSPGISNGTAEPTVRTTSTASSDTGIYERTISSIGGGRLEELFMSSAHAKFYTAINTVLIAPCIVGKSTMFRRSHLGYVTDGQGIDFFSENICEDHLIGDLLWKSVVPNDQNGATLGKHAMVFGDLAIQPMAGMSVKEYVARRIRWLRVRKFTVTLATLVEPGTESFLCSLYGAFALTSLPYFRNIFGWPSTWTPLTAIWLVSVIIWAYVDWTLYQKLHSAASIEVDDDTPAFVRPPDGGRRRPFGEWLLAWLGREALAFPVWAWAVFGGATVEWRGNRFWVGMDMKVHEIMTSAHGEPDGNAVGKGKARKD